MEGWAKTKKIAEYAGVSERTVRSWLKLGLRHSRVTSGTLLIKYSWVDEFLSKYEVINDGGKRIDQIVNEVLRDLKGLCASI